MVIIIDGKKLKWMDKEKKSGYVDFFGFWCERLEVRKGTVE